MIIGNVAFYGATKGEGYVRGIAAERFCVRNSGANVVVEGTGDHGLEYMTGGRAVILGPTGRNFAAGMSGGIAYVLDEDDSFAGRCNMSMVSLERVLPESEVSADEPKHRGLSDEAQLKAMIEDHARHTGSAKAKAILADWNQYRAQFVKVYPIEYRRALKELQVAKEVA